ncbi:MAG TPA: 3-deoxy-D-manno-octulosonic acid transferase [Candidatus Omnitrophota bacterium]|nr:3-deoxy-D-manno-octulosonic acid transferase [Candidatus Omnitrophota bacterium]HPT06810.1 3-deoxy-D-manno-octulosonic acid transferase [Candidatus Omnitrophota bacterium]
MYILYDFIFLIIALIYLPVYLFKGKLHGGLKARLGFFPRPLYGGNPIWIHAVSVGEAMMMKSFIEEFRRIFPHKNFVITTVTPTGNTIARTLANKEDCVTYLPFDISFITNRFIRIIKPSMCIIAETELWPNLLRSLHKHAIPVAVVNGRLSDHSLKGYCRFRLLVKPILNTVGLFCVQSQTDKNRLVQIGVDQRRIAVTGNMKFDAAFKSPESTGLRKRLTLSESDLFFVCASTHQGEEEILVRVFKDLVMQFPAIRFCIAPRHPERAFEIEKLLLKEGFAPVRISRLGNAPVSSSQGAVYILDMIGVLMNYYAIADLVFVGGSLVKKGGHNIVEPASLAKPVMTGPYLYNFRDIADLFIRTGACVVVSNQDIAQVARDLLRDIRRRQALGEAGKQVVRSNQGATKRTVTLVQDLARQYGI